MNPADICACGALLTAEERHFYERCEACERDWHERLQNWRKGKTDPILEERLFGRALH